MINTIIYIKNNNLNLLNFMIFLFILFTKQFIYILVIVKYIYVDSLPFIFNSNSNKVEVTKQTSPLDSAL